jgi:hypothetical protein
VTAAFKEKLRKDKEFELAMTHQETQDHKSAGNVTGFLSHMLDARTGTTQQRTSPPVPQPSTKSSTQLNSTQSKAKPRARLRFRSRSRSRSRSPMHSDTEVVSGAALAHLERERERIQQEHQQKLAQESAAVQQVAAHRNNADNIQSARQRYLIRKRRNATNDTDTNDTDTTGVAMRK